MIHGKTVNENAITGISCEVFARPLFGVERINRNNFIFCWLTHTATERQSMNLNVFGSFGTHLLPLMVMGKKLCRLCALELCKTISEVFPDAYRKLIDCVHDRHSPLYSANFPSTSSVKMLHFRVVFFGCAAHTRAVSRITVFTFCVSPISCFEHL